MSPATCQHSPEKQEYSVDQDIIDSFQKTSATRSSCQVRAQELVGGTVTPVAVQGACSYSVYAGPNHEYVVQFRLKSLRAKRETTTLASNVYGCMVPSVSYHCQIGDAVHGEEPLSVLSRVKGISQLDFILAYNFPENSPEYCTKEAIQTIRSAMIVGILLFSGFTSRLANMPDPKPIRDESGAYKMLSLDGLLIFPATKLVT